MGWVAQGALAVGLQQPHPLTLAACLVSEPSIQSQQQLQAALAGLRDSGEHAGILPMWGKLPGQAPDLAGPALGAEGWTIRPPRLPSNLN